MFSLQTLRSKTQNATKRFGRLARHAVDGAFSVLPPYKALLLERDELRKSQHAAEVLRADAQAAIAQAEEAVRRSAHPFSLGPDGTSGPNAATIRKRAAVGTRTIEASWTPASEPTISIVISTYNRIDLLKETIRSIRESGITESYEIVVVDGGSSDGTAKWLAADTHLITIVQHNRIDGVRQRSWGWFTNLGFRAAHADIVMMISDDCLIVPNAVDAGLEALRTAREAGRNVGGVAFYYRDWPLESVYGVQHTIGGMLMVNHGFFLRSALETVGYCEEHLYAFYKADSDLALKMWHAGFEIIESPSSFVEHLILPEERLRIENNVTMDKDRKALLDRWNGRFNHQVFSDSFNKPFRKQRTFIDERGTVSAFRKFVPHRPAEG